MDNTDQNTNKGTKKKSNRKLKTAVSKMAQRIIAAIGASFLPVSSWWISHNEAPANPMLYLLVGAALAFSMPQLVKWVNSWSPSPKMFKAIGFAVLVEFTLILSSTQWLILSALALLVIINGLAAWTQATKKIN